MDENLNKTTWWEKGYSYVTIVIQALNQRLQLCYYSDSSAQPEVTAMLL